MLVLGAMFVTGCATGRWVKEGASEADYYKAMNDCELKTAMAVRAKGEDNPFSFYGQSFKEQCLRGEGFNYVITKQ